MKKIILLVLFFIPIVSFAQGFFKPVPRNLTYRLSANGIENKWLVRPAITITAMQIIFGEQTTIQPLSSMGTGVSYSHFIQQNGKPYQNFSANMFVLFGTEMVESSPLELSIASTVTAWQYLSIGAGFNFMDKKFFILTGISYNFN